MIVFNLSCSQNHTFDGWFRSAEEFSRQAERGLVECPVCGDKEIVKRLSAPHINAGAGRKSPEAVSSGQSGVQGGETREGLAPATLPRLQQHMRHQFTEICMHNTKNVGNAFADTPR